MCCFSDTGHSRCTKVEYWLYDHNLFCKHRNTYGTSSSNHHAMDNVVHGYCLLIGGTGPDGLAAKDGGLAGRRLASATDEKQQASTISSTRCGTHP
jgi:hypothetical protein